MASPPPKPFDLHPESGLPMCIESPGVRLHDPDPRPEVEKLQRALQRAHCDLRWYEKMTGMGSVALRENILQGLDPSLPPTAPGTVVVSTEICPYCHKSLDDENGGCRLTHEHGKHHMPREKRPTYAELEDENRALRKRVAELMRDWEETD